MNRFELGPDWGEKGFIRILRQENICGLTRQVYQPWTSGNSPTISQVFMNNTTVMLPSETSTISGTIAVTSTIFTVIDPTSSGIIKISSFFFVYVLLSLLLFEQRN